jgi:hypothetical protein
MFVKAFHQNVPNADLVLVVLPEFDAENGWYERFGVRLHRVPIPETFSPHQFRLIAFRDYLTVHGNEYEFVLFSDSRDVIFQGNPFDSQYTSVKDPGTVDKRFGVVFSLEGSLYHDKLIRIRDCPYNSNWIKNCFGEDKFFLLQSEPISCSGVTLGDQSSMLDYANTMILAQTMATEDCRSIGGADQGN